MISINEPTECPCCSYPLEKINDQLFCRNTACSAQLSKKIEHFAKTIGIKGLGPKTVEKLNIQEITELFYLDPNELISTVGEKVASKLLDEIERSKQADFATVLASFSIPLIGQTAATKLSLVVNSFDSITTELCKKAGLGDKATENLINWLKLEYSELKEFLPFKFDKVPKSNENLKKVCITGKLKNYKTKAAAAVALLTAGYVIVDSVTKNTDILIDENNSSSTKREKAEQYGIPIINDINTILKLKEII